MCASYPVLKSGYKKPKQTPLSSFDYNTLKVYRSLSPVYHRINIKTLPSRAMHLQKFFHAFCDLSRFSSRLKPFSHVSFSVDQELREVPLDIR